MWPVFLESGRSGTVAGPAWPSHRCLCLISEVCLYMRVCTHAPYVCAFSTGTSGCPSGNVSHLCESMLSLSPRLGHPEVGVPVFCPF